MIYSFIHLNAFLTVGTDATHSFACDSVVFRKVVVKIVYLCNFNRNSFYY